MIFHQSVIYTITMLRINHSHIHLYNNLLGFTFWLLVLSTTQRCKSCLDVVHRARYGKPLWPSGKNPFPTLIFLIDTFTKLLTDSLIIAVHTNLLALAIT